VVADQVPVLDLRKRDAQEFLPFFREFRKSDTLAEDSGDLAERVGGFVWYHTIDLPGGVTTPGIYDHRPLVEHYGLPADMSGLRALDIATFDGFWAFELERRGAQVVATDVDRFSSCDLPPQVRALLVDEDLDRMTSLGFDVAHEALGSKVERIVHSVYDLDPAVQGTFDFVHVADLLLHLQDPLRALQAVRSVTKGQAYIADCFDPDIEPGTTRYLGGWSSVPWWLPSLETLAQMVVDAGFSDVQVKKLYTLRPGGERWTGHWRALIVATP
jgi:tRNA (mo5U34)-methyltransferase